MQIERIAVGTIGLPVRAIMRTAAAEASSHLFREVNVHLLAASPNAVICELMPGWWDDLNESALEPDDGYVQPMGQPGIGVRLASLVSPQLFTVGGRR